MEAAKDSELEFGPEELEAEPVWQPLTDSENSEVEGAEPEGARHTLTDAEESEGERESDAQSEFSLSPFVIDAEVTEGSD